MGLDVSHGCWHGSYSSFMRWREKVCEVAGYGKLRDRSGFGGDTPWPKPEDDPLVSLLHHSDCDGVLASKDCAAVADRLESLLPALSSADPEKAGWSFYSGSAESWIYGLRKAAEAGEDVEFR